jgi:putative protein-disulfide isomerase
MKLIYYADPMCSWCWGFAPVIEDFRESLRAEIDFEYLPGGLRPHTETRLSKGEARSILHHWRDVEEMTGRPFDFDFFEAHSEFIYDTEPACRAVNTAKEIEDGEPLAFHHRLQQRFYAKGDDPTAPSTFRAVADGLNLDVDNFQNLFESNRLRELTRKGFSKSRETGVRGYPTVDLESQTERVRLTTGYCELDKLKAQFDEAKAAIG